MSPKLFGINHSNRDFSQGETWGKNQFNSSFPVSLANYLFDKDILAVYIKTEANLKCVHKYISVKDVYGISPISNNTYFSFESPFLPFQKYIIGNIPRTDLVIMDSSSNLPLRGLEIKLTALPDHQTCDLTESQYGCELVIRPDTIVYLACSIVSKFSSNTSRLTTIIGTQLDRINDWSNEKEVLPLIPVMKDILIKITNIITDEQTPFILQPIWKTIGKSSILAPNCLDVFVWSDLAVLNLFVPSDNHIPKKICRPTRTLIWLLKMIFDYSKNLQIDHVTIINDLSYNTKNDKAFSIGGNGTFPLMRSKELTLPRITKNEIKHIILGGGQKLLSPERRFDAVIFNSSDLF